MEPDAYTKKHQYSGLKRNSPLVKTLGAFCKHNLKPNIIEHQIRKIGNPEIQWKSQSTTNYVIKSYTDK